MEMLNNPYQKGKLRGSIFCRYSVRRSFSEVVKANGFISGKFLASGLIGSKKGFPYSSLNYSPSSSLRSSSVKLLSNPYSCSSGISPKSWETKDIAW